MCKRLVGAECLRSPLGISQPALRASRQARGDRYLAPKVRRLGQPQHYFTIREEGKPNGTGRQHRQQGPPLPFLWLQEAQGSIQQVVAEKHTPTAREKSQSWHYPFTHLLSSRWLDTTTSGPRDTFTWFITQGSGQSRSALMSDA